MTVVDAMAERVTKKGQILAVAEERPGATDEEIAAAVGCNEGYVHQVLLYRRDEDGDTDFRTGTDGEVVRCRRCEFLDDPANPLAEVAPGEWECLWCRMEGAGVSVREWCESGGWEGVVVPREPEDPAGKVIGVGVEALMRQVRAEMADRGEVAWVAAERMGMPYRTLLRFLNGRSRLSSESCRRLAGYLGMREGQVWAMAGYGQGDRG